MNWNNKSDVHEIHFLMEKALELFPSMKKIIAIAQIENKTHMIQQTDIYSLPEYLPLNDNSQSDTIEKLRVEIKNTSWFSEDDLPFSISPTRLSQKLMFDELANVVLCIPFGNRIDKKNDLLFLYFNPDSGNFGMSITTRKLSTETKTMLAHLSKQSLYNQLETFRKTESSNQDYRQSIQKIAAKYQQLKEEKNKELASDNERLIKYCKHILTTISTKSGLNSEFSGDSLTLLEQWNGNLWNLEHIIQNAFDFAWKSRTQLNLPLLVIEDWHLDMSHSSENDKNEDIIKITESKYLKTYALLERLEESAKRVIGNAQNLTGANVGTSMNQPISAAAITDAIKKNQSKIRSLLAQFPDRWKIIRSEFKPIVNVLVVKNELDKEAG